MTIPSITADGKRMGSSVRTLLFASLLALATLAGTVGVPFSDASSAAPVARDQTLFGMDVPSLGQLDVPFIVDSSAHLETLLEEFSVTQKSSDEIRTLLQSCERALVFS